MYTAKISSKGWIVIPKDLREKYGLKHGSQVQLLDYGDVLALIPLSEDPIADLDGLLADGPSLTADLLAERREARLIFDA